MMFVEHKESDLQVIIDEEKLKPKETHELVDMMFAVDGLKTTGVEIEVILPPMSRFGGGNRDETKKRVIARLMAFFEKFRNII